MPYFPCKFTGAEHPDFFTLHAGELPVKVYYGLKPQPMSLLGVDTTKGIIYCKQGAGRIQLELRGLERQNVKVLSSVALKREKSTKQFGK